MINTTLPYGTYTYKEVVALKDYEINKTIGTFILNKDSNYVEAVIKDKKIPEKQDHPSTNTGNINSGNNGSN